MPNQQEEQQSKSNGKQGATPKMPTLPKAMDKRVSMKWLTLEALSNVMERLEATGLKTRVVLLTAGGTIEGQLAGLKNSFAESFDQTGDALRPDVSSMVTHVRAELLRLYEQEEKELHLVDNAPILSLTDVTITNAQGMRETFGQLTLFADQVIGFSLADVPKMH